MYAQHIANRSPPATPFSRPFRSSAPVSRLSPSNSLPGSGAQTPREVREERWRLEALATERPGKIEMRVQYKELGGRKARSKNKLGSAGGTRDKGGWALSAGGDGDSFY